MALTALNGIAGQLGPALAGLSNSGGGDDMSNLIGALGLLGGALGGGKGKTLPTAPGLSPLVAQPNQLPLQAIQQLMALSQPQQSPPGIPSLGALITGR